MICIDYVCQYGSVHGHMCVCGLYACVCVFVCVCVCVCVLWTVCGCENDVFYLRLRMRLIGSYLHIRLVIIAIQVHAKVCSKSYRAIFHAKTTSNICCEIKYSLRGQYTIQAINFMPSIF